MSHALRFLDGFATTAKLLGLSAAEIASALPEAISPPDWLVVSERASTREARATILAAHVAKVRAAVDAARPRWR